MIKTPLIKWLKAKCIWPVFLSVKTWNLAITFELKTIKHTYTIISIGLKASVDT